MTTPLHLIFYLFSSVALISAVAVVTVHNPVRSVLSLVVTFFATAGLWMILRAEFLSLILVLVYVGAVMTLFLFVIMMLNIDKESKQSGFVRYFSFGLIVVLVMTGLLAAAVGPHYFGIKQMPIPGPDPENYNNLKLLGEVLYTHYVYAFEVAGVLLLAAIIAAITLTHRGPIRRKVQIPSEQIAVRPSDRVRLVRLTKDDQSEA